MANVYTVEQIASLLNQSFSISMNGSQIIEFLAAYDDLQTSVTFATYLTEEQVASIELVKTLIINSIPAAS